MNLNPPVEICGRMNRYSPAEPKRARKEWVVKAAHAGHKRSEIAKALGVTTATISRIIEPTPRVCPFKHDRKPNVLLNWGRAALWRDFTPQQREWLYRLAERDGCENPAEWITETIRDWLEENAETEISDRTPQRLQRPRESR